jgi:HSP20 family protein
MSASRNPFEEMERLFERMGRQFDEAARRWDGGESLGNWMPTSGEMAVDLVERDETFVATVDLPGFTKADIDVEVTDHELRIEAEHEETTEEGEQGRVIRQERRHRSMGRSIRLPEEVDTENVQAVMENGVLTVTLPRAEVESARTIEIS